MTLNISIRKLIKSYVDSGLTAPEMYGMLNKTVSRATVYRWYILITRGQILAKSLPGRPSWENETTYRRKVCLNKKRKSANKIVKSKKKIAQ